LEWLKSSNRKQRGNSNLRGVKVSRQDPQSRATSGSAHWVSRSVHLKTTCTELI
jgi:hypothetical protein